MLKLLAYLGIGGALGTWARYGLSGLLQPPSGSFPWGTLGVNILGSLALGFLMRLLLGSSAGPELRAGLTIGFCGGFTTFSAFSWQTFQQMQKGDWLAAGGNVLLSVVLCLAATGLGARLAR